MTTVDDLFFVIYGHSLELNRLIITDQQNGIAFISRKMGDNGISAYVMPVPNLAPAHAGELTCALGGNGVLSTFIQEQPFYTGRDVARLVPRVQMSKRELLFYCYCIKANRYRFSFGRQANRTLRDIVLPGLNELPAFARECDENAFVGKDAAATSEQAPLLDITSWRPSQLQDLFKIKKGIRITKAQQTPGDTAFISALDNNNGLRQTISGEAKHPAGILTVNYNGNGVAEAYYQPRPFIASDDVNVLYPRFDGLTPLAALLICTVIRLEKYRFNYGRKWNIERMNESIIRLPMKTEGLPDIDYMERFMATLAFSSNVELSAKREEIAVPL